MPLDNAQFISELSITDPTGTDPVNQGDDQIRTTKRATQQSFPNISAPVTLTPAQLNAAAIKSEANTFTQVNTFQASLRAASQSASTPSYGFTADPTTGMFLGAVGLLGFGVGGVDLFNIQASRATFNTVARGSNGSAATPSWSFTNSTNMGLFRNASAQLGVAFGGVEVATFASTNFTTTLIIRGPDGTALLPAFTFASQNNMGWYREANDTFAVAVGGVRQARIFPTLFQLFQDFAATSGTFTGLLQASSAGNANPVNSTDVLTLQSSFTFLNIIGFAKETFYQDTITFNDLADNRPKVRWRTNSSDRWSIGPTGLNGTTFTLSRFSATGVFQDLPWSVDQATGRTTILNRLFLEGGTVELRTAAATTAASYQMKPGGTLFFEMASGNTSSRLLSFVRYNDGGGFLGLPLQIERDTGTIVMPELSTTNPGGSGKLWKSGGFVAIT